MPPLLQRLLSNPATTVEEVEREQRGEVPRSKHAVGGRKSNKGSPGKVTHKPSAPIDVETSKKQRNRSKTAASQPKEQSPAVLSLAQQVQKSITDSCRVDLSTNGDTVKPSSGQLVPYSLPILQLPRHTDVPAQHLRANSTSEPVVTMATTLASRILPSSLASSTSGLITPQALCQSAGQLTGLPCGSTSHVCIVAMRLRYLCSLVIDIYVYWL